VRVRDNLTGDVIGDPADPMDDTNSVLVPFRGGAPGVLDLTTLRARLAAKAPNSGGSLEPNEYALQMLRFPYRQVFGDPQDKEGQKFYGLNKFKVTIPITTWKQTVIDNLNRVRRA
jgi:hypothetical protein